MLPGPVALLLLAYACVSNAQPWNYMGPAGPDTWAQSYPGCGQLEQSPIDIVTKTTRYKIFPEFDADSYDTAPASMWLSNSNHTAMLTINGNIRTMGGGMPTEYKMGQFHFHWGADSTRGSEHSVNGEHYPLELHFVHYRFTDPNLAASLQVANGVAIYVVFFEISKANNTSPILLSVIEGLRSILMPGQSVLLEPLPFQPLLPKDLSRFYRYHGSMTSPPCQESVVWTVFTEHLFISKKQLSEFRNLRSGEPPPNDKLIDNFRPEQPRNGRIVYRSFTIPLSSGSCRRFQTSAFISTLPVLLSAFKWLIQVT